MICSVAVVELLILSCSSNFHVSELFAIFLTQKYHLDFLKVCWWISCNIIKISTTAIKRTRWFHCSSSTSPPKKWKFHNHTNKPPRHLLRKYMRYNPKFHNSCFNGRCVSKVKNELWVSIMSLMKYYWLSRVAKIYIVPKLILNDDLLSAFVDSVYSINSRLR